MPTNNKNLIFPTEALKALNDIVRRYRLEEDPEVAYEKIKQGKDAKATLIAKLARSLAFQELSPNETTELLKNKLDLTPKTANQLLRELQEKVVSLACEPQAEEEKDTLEAIDEAELSDSDQKKNPNQQTSAHISQKRERPMPTKPPQQPPFEPGSDAYRESIE